MKIYKTILLLSLIFILTNCKYLNFTDSPEEVGKKFIDLIFSNKVSEAKQMCSPSAIETIENLEKLNAFKFNEDTTGFKILEITTPQTIAEGKIATFNYRIKNRKDYIELVFQNGEWKIYNSESLLQIRCIPINACDYIQNKNYLHEDLINHRVKLFNLTSIDDSFFPIDTTNNVIYVSEYWIYTKYVGSRLEMFNGKYIRFYYNQQFLKTNSDYFSLKFTFTSEREKEKIKNYEYELRSYSIYFGVINFYNLEGINYGRGKFSNVTIE